MLTPPGSIKRDDIKSFYYDYMHSPNYLKRLRGMGYNNPVDIRNAREKQLRKTEIINYPNWPDGGSQFLPKYNKIIFDPVQTKSINYPEDEVLAHEISHAAGAIGRGYVGNYKLPDEPSTPLTLNKNEINALDQRNKYTKIDLSTIKDSEKWGNYMHDSNAKEFKADIDTLRYKLKKDKIYNTGTQEFNKTFLNKAKQKYNKDPIFQRLIDRVSDDNLIYLMNNIADTNIYNSSQANNGITMRVNKKNLLYSGLPSIKDLKKIMKAQQGLSNPGQPPDYRLKNLVKTLPDNYFDFLGSQNQPQNPQSSNPASIGRADTRGSINPIQAPEFPSNPGIHPTTNRDMRKPGMNVGDALLYAGLAFDAAIPGEKYNKHYPIRPEMSQARYPQGTGSQAIMDDGGWMMNPDRDTPIIINEGTMDNTPSAKDGKWIQKAVNPKHKGYCTPMTKKTCTPRRKALARTFKKHHGFHKKDDGGYVEYLENMLAYGGIIPDNMSAFTQYANGGSNRGGSDTTNIFEQIVMHPNMSDMQGWDGYAMGGSMRGGSDTMNIFEQIVMHPNESDMKGWDKAKKGKTLTRAKAREILHDKTAHGHPLTEKQRRYMGAVASGYAAMGEGVPGGGNPPFNTQNLIAYNSPQSKDMQYLDQLNYVLASGNMPKGGLHGYNADQQNLIRSAYLWKGQNVGKRPEDVISGFFNRPITTGNTADAYRQKLNTYNNSAVASYYDSPNVDLQQRQGRPIPTLNFDDGGIMYADGGEVETLWGGNVQPMSYNPYDGGTMQFNGDSHEEGGIGMHYNGNPVEVEGGETASRDSQGNLNIFGNMYLPGTRTKFKTVAKEMGQKEKRYDYLNNRGSELVNNTNIANKYDRLSFNAGRAMMSGGTMGQRDIAEKKENLAHLQRAMLDTADEYGLDAQEMSKGNTKKAKKNKQAKGGTYIPFAENGNTTNGVDQQDPNQPLRADRNKNPGNIKYGKFAKQYGATGKDKDGFAIFPSREVGEKAMRSLLTSSQYKDKTVNEAIKSWTGGKPYKHNLGALENTKVSDLSPEELSHVMRQMQIGEGTRYGGPNVVNPRKPATPISPYRPPELPNIPLTPDQPRVPVNATPPDLPHLQVPTRPTLPTNAEGLGVEDIAPELFGAATNKVEPVPAQFYHPELYTPYQVSFQDRINQNQATYNSLNRQLGATNPTALSAIAAQKYAADSGVKADEFRTNQAISNDITNRNIALMNDAQLKNLGIADQQMVRQSTARSKTREFNQMILNSLSSKYAQNQLEQKTLKAYENLYDFRFVPTDQNGLQATYMGPDAVFNYGRNPLAQSNNADVKTVSRYDRQGNLRGYTTYSDDRLKQERDAMELEMQRRKLPLLTTPPLQ